MNREDRRKLTKKLKGKGVSEKSIAQYIELQKLKDNQLSNEEFLEGQKVVLNYEQITGHKDYIKNKNSTESHVIRYHEFVESHKDQVMTVSYDKDHERHKYLVTLVEDESEDIYKFLWWTGDLIKINEEKCE